MVKAVFLHSNLKGTKYKEIFIIVRSLAVAISWEKSNKGLNFPVVCVNKQKETQFGSKGGGKSTKLDD